MNPAHVHSLCTPQRCVRHAVDPLSTVESIGRWVALARAVSGPDLRTRARQVLDALGIRLAADMRQFSEPGPTGTLIVANHISWLDIVALLAVEPAGFLAKREVASWPVIGRTARGLGTLFVDRHRLRALPASVAELAGALNSGRSVVAFPEATTWCSGPGGQFRRAPFQAALDAGAPVRPVRIEYLQAGEPSTVAAFVGDDTLLASMRRVCAARQLEIRLLAMPAIEPADDRRALAARAQHMTREALTCSTY